MESIKEYFGKDIVKNNGNTNNTIYLDCNIIKNHKFSNLSGNNDLFDNLGESIELDEFLELLGDLTIKKRTNRYYELMDIGYLESEMSLDDYMMENPKSARFEIMSTWWLFNKIESYKFIENDMRKNKLKIEF